MASSSSTPEGERLAAEATGHFLCMRKRDGVQELKCQRPCDDCWEQSAYEDHLFNQGRVGEPGKLDI